MDSGTKEFEQQLMLGLEYLSCSETEEKKQSIRYHNAEKRATPAPVSWAYWESCLRSLADN
jgi:hypothetical protein